MAYKALNAGRSLVKNTHACVEENEFDKVTKQFAGEPLIRCKKIVKKKLPIVEAQLLTA
jgi:hypothetical protein